MRGQFNPNETDSFIGDNSLDPRRKLKKYSVLVRGTIPTAATSQGTAGDYAYDANYLYLCVSTNLWRRIPLTW